MIEWDVPSVLYGSLFTQTLCLKSLYVELLDVLPLWFLLRAGRFHRALGLIISGVLHRNQASGNHGAKVDQAWKRCSSRARTEILKKLRDGGRGGSQNQKCFYRVYIGMIT